MFGRPANDSDPLLYITRCHDFLAVHPLMDTDILTTFRTVLYGTARDWWEVARCTARCHLLQHGVSFSPLFLLLF